MFPHSFQQNNQPSKSPFNTTQSLPNGLSKQNYHQPTQQSTQILDHFIDVHKINSTFAAKLKGLKGYEIVFICDDSGSMNSPLDDVVGPYEKRPTRWDELKHTVSVVVDIATALDPDGVDIYFLNRKPIRNVTKIEQIAHAFAAPPAGTTPLTPVLRQVLHEKRNEIKTRKLLIVIATDGEPTDAQGNKQIDEFRNVLQYERVPIDRIPVTIMACTDDNSIAYLNNWDKELDHLDVVDDYRSEKSQILACQGPNFPFSYGDYIVKILMGPIDDWFDNLDEKPVSLDDHKKTPTKTQSLENTYRSSYPSVR